MGGGGGDRGGQGWEEQVWVRGKGGKGGVGVSV